MKSMESAMTALFARRELPERVLVMRDWGVLQSGEVLTWDNERQGYVTENGRWVLMAFAARMRWGTVFCQAAQAQAA